MAHNKGSLFKEEDGSEEIDPQVGLWEMNELSHPSSMIVFVHLFIKNCHSQSYHNNIKYHTTLNIMFSVVRGLDVSPQVGVVCSKCKRSVVFFRRLRLLSV